MQKFKNAGADPAAVPQTFWQKNQKTILIVGAVIVAGLLFIPDVYMRKYVPWVK